MIIQKYTLAMPYSYYKNPRRADAEPEPTSMVDTEASMCGRVHFAMPVIREGVVKSCSVLGYLTYLGPHYFGDPERIIIDGFLPLGCTRVSGMLCIPHWESLISGAWVV